MHFDRGDARPAGHVFVIPAPLVHLADRKPRRPFLLLNRCAASDVGSLAPMTTKSTERVYGATLLELPGERGKLALPDQESSYVNLSSLIFLPARELSESHGSLVRYLPAVRAALKAALGIGTGLGAAVPGQSLRGCVVRLSNEMARTFEFRFGIVITEHRYSEARRREAIVPLIDVSAFLADGETVDDFRPEPGDVFPQQTAEWLRQLPAWRTMPVVDTARLTSFSHPWRRGSPDTWLDAQIEQVYPVPIDATTLIAIESALTARFKLP